MCYSFKTSIISYTIGMLSAVFALYTRQYILGTLILFYVQIQLSEMIIWKGIDDNNQHLNKIGTLYGKYTLPSHLIGLGLGYLLAVYFLEKKTPQLSHFIPLIIGIIFYLIILLGPYNDDFPDTTYPLNKNCINRTCQNNNNRLNWPFPTLWYLLLFALVILFIILYMKPIDTVIFIIVLFSVTLALSFILLPLTAVRSMWCFSAAIIAPVVVLVNYFIIRNKSNSEILT